MVMVLEEAMVGE
uniref:Uncharacterized protein n=1 Tax=Arundo donax TaxID=35708 RepID=A0A0A9H2R4_ARUDO